MDLVISVINPKGGTGKTTVSILLAGQYAENQKVALIDADDNKNLRQIMKSQFVSDTKNEGITVFAGSADKDIPALIRKVKSEFEIVIIDMPSQMNEKLDQYILKSDLLLIPTTIGEQERRAIQKLELHLNALKEADKTDHKFNQLIVFNRVSLMQKKSPIFDDQKRAFKTMNFKFADAVIQDRISYSLATTARGDLYTLGDKTSTTIIKAKENIELLQGDIFEFMSWNKSKY